METNTSVKGTTQEKQKRPRIKRTPPKIDYQIGKDVLDQKASISVRDLITVSPAMRRQLISECKPSRSINQNEQTMALIEDDDMDTTAVYSQVSIANKPIRALIDCGAAKTCMSKKLADELGLKIDASSESVFTLGNGTKQPALGVIYDVPLEVKRNMAIPCTIEVLPICPNQLIIGNNWLSRAKARIDFNNSSLKVTYKENKAELKITYLQKDKPKVTSYKETYQQPKSLTNSKKHVHFEESTSEEENEADNESESFSDEESSSEDQSMSTEEEHEPETPLFVLEKNKTEEVSVTEKDDGYIIAASADGLRIQANSSKRITLNKPRNQYKNIFNFETTNPKLLHALGYFDTCINFIVNKRNVEIRIYNRSKKDIFIKPNEEIGTLEKFNTTKDTIVKAYVFDKSPQLNVMDIQQKTEPLGMHLYSKLEVGEIDKKIIVKLRRLLKKYKEIFDWDNDTIGHTELLKHKIIIENNAHPISHRPYRISPIEAEYLQKELDKYCKLGVITPSNSPWAAPVILVKKKNGDYRMVIDYRKLNAITKKDSYPLPRIDDLLDTLGKAKIFSALDMRAGFHQVPLEQDSKELTAFTTKFGTYHYNTLPMGLVNSPATFQRLIDLCFRPLINKCLVAYIDDLNVYSLDHHQHLNHLEQVFQCIQIANLKLNPEKCFFFKDHLKFLGYMVTKDGIQTDPSKIEKIINYPIPKSTTQVRAFLGLASYYRRFIKNFAAIARPLHDQTKTSKNIPWTQKTTDSFEKLKQLLTTAPVLARPDFNKPFLLVTDASKAGLGCILTQLDENGHEHPIVFASRALKTNEANYAATKLECLAVIWAVKQFRPYLLGQKFTIITDHSALNGLLKASNPTGIIARWITILTEYEFEIKYRPGRVNESADFLSRLGY